MNEYQSPSIFDEIEKERPFFEYAATWQRMLNLTIDTFAFLAFYMLVLIIIFLVADLMGNDLTAMEQFFFNKVSTAYFTIGLLYTLFYTLQEGLLKGRTIGKLITKTQAVKPDLSAISMKDAMVRSVARLLPFEVFSGFNKRTWHDRLSETMVIKKGKSG